MSPATSMTRLPSDLLDNIFHLAVVADVSLQTPIILSHVSSDWRTRAINNPSIWRRLFILLDHSIVRKHIDRIDAFIQRSCPLPLYIIIDAKEVEVEPDPDVDLDIILGPDSPGLTELGPQILSSLALAASRWQILDVVTLFFQHAPFPTNLNLPMLERLLIRKEGYVGSELVSAFLRAPRLRILEVPTEWRLQGRFKIPWSQIQHAEIAETDLLACHEQMTRLKTLRIHGSFDVNPSQTVHLPTVSHVTINLRYFSRVIEHFKLDNLISLEICSTFWDSGQPCPTPVISRYISLGHIGPSLRHLSTHFPQDLRQFKRLLQEIPLLETLNLLCIWALDSTDFPESCACFFRDLTTTNSSLVVPRLAKLTLRGVPYLAHDFQEFIRSRGPYLHVSVIFMAEYPSSPLDSHAVYMHQWALYSWLEIRPHILELKNSLQISIHVEGETTMLVAWGADLVTRHKENAKPTRFNSYVWYLSADIPNYIWGENKWPSSVGVPGVTIGGGRGMTAGGVRTVDLEASRALAKKYQHIGSLERVTVDPF